MFHAFRFIPVILLLGAAAALATPRGRIPLALRGLRRTLRRDAGLPDAPARETAVPLGRRLLALLLVLAALVVAVVL